jgi:ankyrin repeat protein
MKKLLVFFILTLLPIFYANGDLIHDALLQDNPNLLHKVPDFYRKFPSKELPGFVEFLIKEKKPNILLDLIKNQLIDINSVFFIALQTKNFDVAESLLLQGANPNAKTPEGLSLLAWALTTKNKDIANYLLDKAVNIGDTINGLSLINVALSLDLDDIALKIIKKGGALHTITKTDDGRIFTALHQAIEMEKEKIAKSLIEYGALLDAVNEKGETPLDIALRKNYTTLIKLLGYLQAPAQESYATTIKNILNSLSNAEKKEFDAIKFNRGLRTASLYKWSPTQQKPTPRQINRETPMTPFQDILIKLEK